MTKTKTAIAVFFFVGIIIGAVPTCVLTTGAADGNTASHTLDYYSTRASARVVLPSTSNISQIAVYGIHVEQGTLGRPDVLAVYLWSTALNTFVAGANIATNPNPESYAWLRKIYNGSSVYTEVNGNVIINNIFQVTASELKVQRNAMHATIDFNPARSIAITLPRDAFPAANYSATWVLPAFHMDFDGYGNATVSNSSSTNPNGWVSGDYYVSYSANATFTSSALNYNVAGTSGTLRVYQVATSTAPAGSAPFVIPAQSPFFTFYDARGNARLALPPASNMSQMALNALHVPPNIDVLVVYLWSPALNALVPAADIANNPDPASYDMVKGFFNGTMVYTEVNGNVIINNVFQVGTNELKVLRNGTHISVDYTPTRPLAITLARDSFPAANFSAPTWVLPAFHMDWDASGSPSVTNSISISTAGVMSGSYYVSYPAANATFTSSALNNYTTIPATASVRAYELSMTKIIPNYKPLATTAFCNVTVLSGWTWWFFAHSTGGIGSHTYQWYEGTTQLQGQTSMVLPVTKMSSGTYTFYCKVTDSEGAAANSNTVTLTVR